MFADKIFTPTTVSLFGFTGLASFIAALFTGLFIGTMFFTRAADRFGRRTVFTYLAGLVLHRHAGHGVPVPLPAGSTCGG